MTKYITLLLICSTINSGVSKKLNVIVDYEDNPINLMLLVKVLENTHYQTLSAVNGKEARMNDFIAKPTNKTIIEDTLIEWWSKNQ